MADKCVVVHCRREPFDVYIGRPSVWGNPYSHKSNTKARYLVSSAEEAVLEYREWLRANPKLIERARRELRGKVLGCWCKTKANPGAPCHGDVLAQIANGEEAMGGK